jgi:hypothetical protein
MHGIVKSADVLAIEKDNRECLVLLSRDALDKGQKGGLVREILVTVDRRIGVLELFEQELDFDAIGTVGLRIDSEAGGLRFWKLHILYGVFSSFNPSV